MNSMTPFLRLKILFFLFLTLECGTASSDQPSPKIDYCATISFDMGNFDANILKDFSSRGDCRQRPIPLQLKTKEGLLKAKIDLRLASYGGFPVPFKRGNGTNPYIVDEKAAASSIKKWADDKKINLNEMTYKINFYSTEKPTGTALISRIDFFEKNGERGLVVADYYFFKRDAYAALYTSGFLNPKDKSARLMMREVEKLFLSMEIDW